MYLQSRPGTEIAMSAFSPVLSIEATSSVPEGTIKRMETIGTKDLLRKKLVR